MKIDWRDILRHYLQVVAFCFAIAAVTTTFWSEKTYLNQLGYSLCIGSMIWAVIEFGRYPLRRPEDAGGWPHGWRGVLLTMVGIVAGFIFGSMIADTLFGDGDYTRWMDSKRESRVSWMVTVLAGVLGSYFFYSRGRSSSLAARVSAAERDASEARLKLLETQLEPHMLFNTLANLRALIATDPERAIAMLDRLNNYLRATLSGSRQLSHPLDAEFERLADYLELMAVRMDERLRFSLELAPDARELQVPPLILQPLVENSIRHGLEPQVEGGEVRVRAQVAGNGADAQLLIEVSDTGVGIGEQEARLPPQPVQHSSFGLAHVRERLATVYGARAGLTLQAMPGGGTRALIHIPIATSSSS